MASELLVATQDLQTGRSDLETVDSPNLQSDFENGQNTGDRYLCSLTDETYFISRCVAICALKQHFGPQTNEFDFASYLWVKKRSMWDKFGNLFKAAPEETTGKTLGMNH
jgi:hypothetical protein